MKVNTLPSPGLLSNGIKLRVEAAKALSSVEIAAMRTPGGKVSTAAALQTFFDACSDALDTLVDTTVPTMAAATGVAASATKITLDFVGSDMDETVVPLPAAFVVNNGGTVSAVAWGTAGDAGKLVLTGTGYAAGDTVTYTQPAANALRDLVGNLIASGVNTVA
jgi:hypothetical protein